MREDSPDCRLREEDFIDMVTVAGCGVLEETEVVLVTVCRTLPSEGLMGSRAGKCCVNGLVSRCDWERGN